MKRKGTANAVKTTRNAFNVGCEELDLRKWCVETAIRFPNTVDFRQYQAFPQSPAARDVLGDAQRIYDWVTRE